MGQTFVQLRLIIEGDAALEYVHMGEARLPRARPTACSSSIERTTPHPHPRRAEMKLPRFYQFLMMLEEARAKLDMMA